MLTIVPSTRAMSVSLTLQEKPVRSGHADTILRDSNYWNVDGRNEVGTFRREHFE